MNTAEEIISDKIWNDGYERCNKKCKKSAVKIEWVLNTLLSAGTSEDDDTIKELKSALLILNS